MYANPKVERNLSTEQLVERALALKEGELAANLALVVKTGKRTGRSPKDRFIVRDENTEHEVDWNKINQPLATEKFNALWQKAYNYLLTKDTHFISELKVGAHPTLGATVTVITELAWQNLFAKDLFININNKSEKLDIDTPASHWEMLSVPGFNADPNEDGVNGEAAVILNFTQHRILICGTYYAGEMKKAMFSALNFILPIHDILPMHCAANQGKDGNTVLFFGLSGTGKTTLSADTERFLIGDDEHGWGEEGIFNFEGGCYAKCIDLSKEREPLIWDAIKFGTVLENVVIDPITKQPNYADSSLTQNTRAAYPLLNIPKRVEENRGPQPKAVIFLTCDLYGVLPPVAKLSTLQAAYYFLSGYTAMIGSTEVGQGSGITPTFSTCFGAPFFPRRPSVYADLLMKRLKDHEASVYLVNTGWTGGPANEGGNRFSIPMTRAIVSSIVNGELKDAQYENLPGFNLAIPTALPVIPKELLNPAKNWQNPTKYREISQQLIKQFIDNFKRFDVNSKIREAGPTLDW